MKIGDLISFSYPAVHKQGTKAHDKNPKVLVLHPEWGGTLHGLNFNYLTNDEVNMARMILSPKFQLQHKAALTRRNPNLVKEFDRIIGEAGAATITSPHDFYTRAVKPFIAVRGWDPYRRYSVGKMTNVRVLEPYEIMSGEKEPGLFKKFAQRFSPMRGPRFRR